MMELKDIKVTDVDSAYKIIEEMLSEFIDNFDELHGEKVEYVLKLLSENAYNAGFEDGTTEAQESLYLKKDVDFAYNDGYENGKKAGYEIGFDEGYFSRSDDDDWER